MTSLSLPHVTRSRMSTQKASLGTCSTSGASAAPVSAFDLYEHAMDNKRKASEALTGAAQELNAERTKHEEASSKAAAFQKTIADLEEARERAGSLEVCEVAQTLLLKALEDGIAEAKRELKAIQLMVESQGNRINEMERNQIQCKNEELQATRLLEEVESLLSASREKEKEAGECGRLREQLQKERDVTQSMQIEAEKSADEAAKNLLSAHAANAEIADAMAKECERLKTQLESYESLVQESRRETERSAEETRLAVERAKLAEERAEKRDSLFQVAQEQKAKLESEGKRVLEELKECLQATSWR
eukprot:1237144-Rhodomonas_salina.2